MAAEDDEVVAPFRGLGQDPLGGRAGRRRAERPGPPGRAGWRGRRPGGPSPRGRRRRSLPAARGAGSPRRPSRRASQPPTRTSALPGSPTAVQIRMRPRRLPAPPGPGQERRRQAVQQPAEELRRPSAARLRIDEVVEALPLLGGDLPGRIAAPHAPRLDVRSPSARARSGSAARSGSTPSASRRDPEHGDRASSDASRARTSGKGAGLPWSGRSQTRSRGSGGARMCQPRRLTQTSGPARVLLGREHGVDQQPFLAVRPPARPGGCRGSAAGGPAPAAGRRGSCARRSSPGPAGAPRARAGPAEISTCSGRISTRTRGRPPRAPPREGWGAPGRRSGAVPSRARPTSTVPAPRKVAPNRVRGRA